MRMNDRPVPLQLLSGFVETEQPRNISARPYAFLSIPCQIRDIGLAVSFLSLNRSPSFSRRLLLSTSMRSATSPNRLSSRRSQR